MQIAESRIRECCTEAVFERGVGYREDGRIERLDRFGSVLTAKVRGSERYDVTVEVSETGFDPRCTCPYSGPGECKHVVAVLLEAAADPPSDERERVEAILEEIPPEEIRSFLMDELARDPETRDRFFARFGEPSGKSVEEYRDEVDRLFEEHTDDYPVVVEAIDFSRFTELAEEYRSRERYRAAATIYRALAEGIEGNMDRVDAAYDHYTRTFGAALDGYVECVLAADPSDEEFEQHVEALSVRSVEAVDYLGERYADAVERLRSER